MKHINDIVNGLEYTEKPTIQASSVPGEIDDQTAKIVDKIFVRLASVFPAFKHAWPSQEQLNNAKYEWTQAFMRAKLSDVDQIKHGLNKFADLKSPFIPSPGQFIAMCKEREETPAAYAFSLAYKLAGSDSWDHSNPLHQLTYHAWKSSGVSFMRDEILNKSADRLKVFSRNYDIACNMRADGEPLTSIPLAIGDPNSVSRSAEVTPVGSAALAAIKTMLIQ